jgi:hypothetical protein
MQNCYLKNSSELLAAHLFSQQTQSSVKTISSKLIIFSLIAISFVFVILSPPLVSILVCPYRQKPQYYFDKEMKTFYCSSPIFLPKKRCHIKHRRGCKTQTEKNTLRGLGKLMLRLETQPIR